jgi:hypothetical protein
MSPIIDANTRDRRIVDPKIVFTASFVLGLLLLVVLRTNGWRLPPMPSWITPGAASAPAGPEDAIYGMLDAARAGDTQTYLDSFSRPMRDQLLQVIQENTGKENAEASFAAYLKSQNSAFQGVAVSVTDHPNDTEAQVRVEYVYGNRNEVQSVYLRKDSRWRIVKVAGSEQIKTLLPFGSAVAD